MARHCAAGGGRCGYVCVGESKVMRSYLCPQVAHRLERDIEPL